MYIEGGWVEGNECGLKIGGQTINKLCYSNNWSVNVLEALVMKTKEHGEKNGNKIK